MSLIRGVLLAGDFRSHLELNRMSQQEQRQLLIRELAARTHQALGPLSESPMRRLNRLNDDELAGVGAVFAFLREAGIRTDDELRRMTADDMRNTLIVEVNAQTQIGQQLQGWSNMQLVERALGYVPFGTALQRAHFLRGVLLAGRFRTHRELSTMSEDDMRDTLIVELTGRTNQRLGRLSPSPVRRFQAMDSFTLAGCGAAYIFLRDGKIRREDELKVMSDDDIRNTLIAEVHAQTNLGNKLQELPTLDVVGLGLGVDPERVLPTVHPDPIQPNSAKLQFRLRGFHEYEGGDDALQGAGDEVFLSAQGVDSAQSRIVDGEVVPRIIDAGIEGDVSEDSVRGPWAQHPKVLLEFDFSTPAVYPRTYVVTLLFVEHDNQDVAEVFQQVKEKVGDVVREKITTEAASLGASIGTAISPGVGTAVGAAVGALVGLAWDELIPIIGEGLANEVYSPKILSLQLNGEVHPDIDRPLSVRVREHGADYELFYDWHVDQDL